MTKGRPARGRGRATSARHPRTPVVPLDAEDIAMARLQAHVRKTEAIRGPDGLAATSLDRTTVQIPRAMLHQVRDRARRDGATVSEVVEVALQRYLKSR
ncbi:MAG: ribbon-helix-helix protein, CopG family [candidate division NC10 bacterium]|nr:ribbon-helix-helix protein, CopG family [candidate division NC10 bacterium]MBI2115444.1 ribbon-helix-helix protein, CopG family [candidate division NC10 bacterium]MBI2162999.1 ribbon-helix-helix protein, CopG family [candidate division NC10 bacterium]MBI2458819.1 ribbon-helix-helix protein, CopG family [candidate division NC10 bacterium]MBI2562664.1 ribbon-helix-helix protein, CopG family [candidate division NC10 bacterium]